MEFVSAMQYYSYMLYDKADSYIHLFQRLFHQYIVDQYSKIEGARLNFIKHNQESLRADLYQNIKEASLTALGYTIGKRIVLSSSFKGCDRYFAKLYQDGMALIRAFGKPDYFITVTCNPA
jgi:ATP-dependent DNA helicase PIF1